MSLSKNMPHSASTFSPPSEFPVVITRETFQRDVVVLYTHQFRTAALMRGLDGDRGRDLWSAMYNRVPTFPKSDEAPNAIYYPGFTVDDFGLCFADIANTWFAAYLDNMYQYAYYGISDDSIEQMEEDTICSWLVTIVYDLSRSAYLEKWRAFDGEGKQSATRCLEVAELANARRILEVGVGFSSLLSSTIRDEGVLSEGALTVRQMALLAGMEEMSIRAAANPKRATPLKTCSDKGRTRILISDAKDWLQTRDRYVPIRTHNAKAEFDLEKKAFTDVSDLARVVDARLQQLAKEIVLPDEPHSTSARELDSACFADTSFVRDLATLLEFPPMLFLLRVKEVLAKEVVEQVQRDLRDIVMTPDSFNRKASGAIP